jgi:hypothetical protein
LRDGRQPTAALVTREVFLDTEAFQRVEFDVTHPTLVALFKHVDEGRLKLHVTDITLREVLRHMLQMTDKLVSEINGARESLKTWKTRVPDALADQKIRKHGLEGPKLGNEYFARFRSALRAHQATEHAATARNALPIFIAYFERKAPFDGKNYKEFPDAFVLDALEGWCEAEGARMYVVTHDQAMLRAATGNPRLLPIENLANLLEIVTADHAPDVEQAVEAIVELPEFTNGLEAAIDGRLGDVGANYLGDLSDGEVLGLRRNGEPRNLDWTVISAGDGRFGIVVSFDIDIQADVDFEDRDLAFYDKEDDRYYGAETASTEIEAEADLKMFVEVDTVGKVVRSEMLTRDIDIQDWQDNYH